tara:strand:+ start:201 stop:629 length:429 start_codon:yes stop_codon:yes gene_type:complete
MERENMGRASLDTDGEIAVIDLVAHLYSTKGFRRDLCAIWDKYSAATTEERKQKGFEIVRNYHSQLTRMFRDGTLPTHFSLVTSRFSKFLFFMPRVARVFAFKKMTKKKRSFYRVEKRVIRNCVSHKTLAYIQIFTHSLVRV